MFQFGKNNLNPVVEYEIFLCADNPPKIEIRFIYKKSTAHFWTVGIIFIDTTMSIASAMELLLSAELTSVTAETSNIEGSATAACIANVDLCRNIATYCDGVDLLQLGQVNTNWKRIATIQFLFLMDLLEYKFLTLHRRHSISSIKRACWQISNKRNRNENSLCLFGGAYQSPSKVMCTVADSNHAIECGTVGKVKPQVQQDLPRTLSCSACTSDCDGNILILGGWDDLADDTVAAVRSFNTQEPVEDRRWTRLQPLCQPRCFGAAVALSTGDLLHIGGGSSQTVGGECFSETYIRRANTTHWQENIVPSVLQARYGHSAFELFSGDVVVTGGYAGDTTFLKSVEMLTNSLDRWIALPEMSVPRSFMAAVLGPCGSIYVAGGTLDGSVGHNSAERYDPREGHWAPLADMHVRRLCTTGCVSVCNNGFYALGGTHESTYNYNMEFYDFRMNQWTLMVGAPENHALLGRAVPYLKLDL